MAKAYYDDNMFTWGNSVGVCWDYTNIMAIMCRHCGIPCTSADMEDHTFTAVWLNGGWVGIDITMFNRYNCLYENTDKTMWKPNKIQPYAPYYGCYDADVTEYDTSIWTHERGLGIHK